MRKCRLHHLLDPRVLRKIVMTFTKAPSHYQPLHHPRTRLVFTTKLRCFTTCLQRMLGLDPLSLLPKVVHHFSLPACLPANQHMLPELLYLRSKETPFLRRPTLFLIRCACALVSYRRFRHRIWMIGTINRGNLRSATAMTFRCRERALPARPHPSKAHDADLQRDRPSPCVNVGSPLVPEATPVTLKPPRHVL